MSEPSTAQLSPEPDLPQSDSKLCVVHVGAHKTGTTMLQNYLRVNAKALRKHRIFFVTRPQLAVSVGWGRALVKNPERFQAHLDTFDKTKDVDLLIASHEDTLGHPFEADTNGRLYPSAGENLAALAAALHGRQVRVVLSIRPQADFLESYYLQTVHEGSSKTFDEWLRDVDLEALSWRPIVTLLGELFGTENTELIDFRLIRDGQDAYLKHFLSRLDARLDMHVAYEDSHNRSISEKGLRMARAANPHLRSTDERRAMRRFLQTHFSNADYPRAVLLSDDQRTTLTERYSAEYDELVGVIPPVSQP
ncbi:MAG: hypothetical protein JWQ77_759 [Jatrophihabitans sp.]|nr:hypothetical protein [Jatrophihabitans sp.]